MPHWTYWRLVKARQELADARAALARELARPDPDATRLSAAMDRVRDLTERTRELSLRLQAQQQGDGGHAA